MGGVHPLRAWPDAIKPSYSHLPSGWCVPAAPPPTWVWAVAPSSSSSQAFWASPLHHSARPHRWTWRCLLCCSAGPSMFPWAAYWWCRSHLRAGKWQWPELRGMCSQQSAVLSLRNKSSGWFRHSFGQQRTPYLQLKGVGVVGAGGEVCVDSGTAAEGASVRRLFVITILRLYTFSVTGWRVSSADCLTTWTQTNGVGGVSYGLNPDFPFLP